MVPTVVAYSKIELVGFETVRLNCLEISTSDPVPTLTRMVFVEVSPGAHVRVPLAGV